MSRVWAEDLRSIIICTVTTKGRGRADSGFMWAHGQASATCGPPQVSPSSVEMVRLLIRTKPSLDVYKPKPPNLCNPRQASPVSAWMHYRQVQARWRGL
jgi:hypothetical protein